MDDDKVKKKYQTKAESAASFGKKKEPTQPEPTKTVYVEKVYTFKDGITCRVVEPKQGLTNDEISHNI